VVIPVGQVFLWHFSAWMQPSANMKPRAEVTKSAPAASAQAISPGFTSLPLATMRMRSLSPISLRKSTSRGSASRIDMPTRSINGMGEAPVPPSPPSSVMKSGALSGPRG
jgi:hypothetical protein